MEEEKKGNETVQKVRSSKRVSDRVKTETEIWQVRAGLRKERGFKFFYGKFESGLWGFLCYCKSRQS